MMSSKSKTEQDHDLEEALEETFPASDANSTNVSDHTPVRPMHRKPPLFDEKLVRDLADEVERDHR